MIFSRASAPPRSKRARRSPTDAALPCPAHVAGLSLGHGILGGMLTDADLARIVAVVATKEDIRHIEERIKRLAEKTGVTLEY
jgi:hypothetical protein